MAGLDREKARTLFQIPGNFEVGAAWALGYLGDPEVLTDELKARETALRSRKPLSAFVFSAWDQAADL
jgi:hypothetical protein